jgi:hypothetical protein
MIKKQSINVLTQWAEQNDLEPSAFSFVQSCDLPAAVFASVLLIMFPDFIERDGTVLLADNSDEEDWFNWTSTEDDRHTDAQYQLNHVHVSDLVDFDDNDPNRHDLAREIAMMIGKCWRMHLSEIYPDRNFSVDVDEEDGWIVTFVENRETVRSVRNPV